MVLAPKFRQGPDTITTFNFDDISSGQGIVDMFLGTTHANSVSGAQLSSTEWYSDQVTSNVDVDPPTTAFVKYFNKEFDVEFNAPIILQGKTVMNLARGVKGVDTNDYGSFAEITIKHVKSDGTTETTLQTVSGAQVAVHSIGAGVYEYYMDAIGLDIPNTKFKKGEFLRLGVGMYTRSSGGAGEVILFMGHDPKGRATTDRETLTFGTAVSTSTLQMPVRINL